MSRTLVSRVLAAILLAGGLFGAHFALAGAASLEDMLAGTLTPSAAPSLLGPITSAGRVGWECKPERAAAAARAHDADLPADASTP